MNMLRKYLWKKKSSDDKSPKTINVSRTFVIFLVAIAIVATIGISMLYSYESSYIPPYTSSITLSPFQSQLQSFDIYTGDGTTKLGTVSGTGLWQGDSAHHYPKIQCWITQPFLVGPDGNEKFSDPGQYIVDPSSAVKFQFADGTYRYLMEVDLAVDISVRTLANMPPAQYHTKLIDPLVGVNFAPVGAFNANLGSSTDCFANSAGTTPNGVLMALLDYGANPWSCSWVDHGVGITNSLEDFTSKSTMVNNLQANYGNSLVLVKPSVTLKAVNNFIKFDYLREINGKKFHVYSKDTYMAIMDASIASQYSKAGTVATYIPESTWKGTMTVINKDAQLGTGNKDSNGVEKSSNGYDTFSGNAWFLCAGTQTDNYFAGQIIPPYGFSYSSISPPAQIDINQFATYPTTATFKVDQYISPYTTVNWATYTGQACGIRYYYCPGIICQGSVLQPQFTMGPFPYQVITQQTYMTTRLVWKVLVLSNDEVDYLPIGGAPQKVDNIVDYGINSVGGLNPKADDAAASGGFFGFNLLTYLSSLLDNLTELIMMIAIVAISVVIGMYVVKRIKKPEPKKEKPQEKARNWSLRIGGREILGGTSGSKDRYK